ncbi:hypothetical protein J2T13_004773 [Paenibacillus sp. DS2015]|uniref:hypothetical protein n=1 Tax=Paenibacillus sp. DS2015 TaxID=3373917 RepID=UPI003D1B2424
MKWSKRVILYILIVIIIIFSLIWFDNSQNAVPSPIPPSNIQQQVQSKGDVTIMLNEARVIDKKIQIGFNLKGRTPQQRKLSYKFSANDKEIVGTMIGSIINISKDDFYMTINSEDFNSELPDHFLLKFTIIENIDNGNEYIFNLMMIK